MHFFALMEATQNDREAKPSTRKKKRWKTLLSLLVKILITIGCFWYISTKIDFAKAWQAFSAARIWLLVTALFLFVLSKFLSAFRLNIYFRNIGLELSSLVNLKLYWLGMFYNLFLPGAISGDAYKVVLLHRRFKTPVKKLSAAVLIDRFSGLLALGVILAVYGLFVLPDAYLNVLIGAGALLAFVGFYAAIRFLFRDFLPGFLPTFFWGLAVQFSQVLCIYCIVAALSLPADHTWIFIFLTSAAVSVLPISLGGGLGTREVVFAEGAKYFGLSPQMAVVISLLFYFITVAGSIFGLYYNFRQPLGAEK